ncbi:MAG: thioredoxin family protein [Anaerolineaceae bacterium 4572_32.1]|nr:MAG: thioredoxin family protein [Anaerolineaceae bacterium 4572_32.1]
MEIKILGTGCPNCKRLESVARAAVLEMGVEATLIKVTDWDKIMAYDIISTPGLVLDEKVVSSGRIPSKAEVVSLLATALDQAGD